MTANLPFSVQNNSGHHYYEPAKQPPGNHVSSKIVRLKAPLALETESQMCFHTKQQINLAILSH